MEKPEFKYEVRDEKAEKVLRDIGVRLSNMMPPGYGFTLMIYSFGHNGSMFYTSNAVREDMIRAMREFIEKFREN